MAAEDPQALAQQIYFLQNPQAGLQYQQQQMLAQQMMQQGSQYPDTHAMVGNVVAPVSPVADASKALQQMLGAYMMNKSNTDYGNAMSPQGQANGQPVGQGQAIGNMISGGSGQADPYAMTPAEMMLPNGAEHYKVRMAVQQPPLKDQYTKGPGDTLMPIPGSPAAGNQSPPPQQQTQPQQPGSNIVSEVFPTQDYTPTAADPGQAGGIQNSFTGNGPTGVQTDFNRAASSPSYAPTNDPAELERRKGLVSGDQKYLNETLLPAYEGAIAGNKSVDSIQAAAAIANSKPITQTGSTAPARLQWAKNINDVISATGGTPLNQDEIAGADVVNKSGTRLAASMTKMLGSREAAQIFDKIQQSNPNWTMQPETLKLVSNLVQQENNTAIGRYKAGFSEAINPLDLANGHGLAQFGVKAYDDAHPASMGVKQAFSDSGMAFADSPTDPNLAKIPKGGKFYDLMPNSPTYGQRMTKQ